MNYQKIRAALEAPLKNAFPSLYVYFDNIGAVPLDRRTEYVTVNLTFGITNEPTLTSSVDNARGALIIRIYTEKNNGPARNQTLITTAVNILETINNSTKGTTGVYIKVGAINGPIFSATENGTHFVGRIDTSYVATVLS